MEILSQPPSMTSFLIRLSTFYVTRNKIKSKSPNSEWQKKPNVGILSFVRVMSFIAFVFAPEPLLQRSLLTAPVNESMGFQLTLHLFQGSCEASFARQINFDSGCPPSLSPLGIFFFLRTSLGTAVMIPISGGLDPSWLWQRELVLIS